jgi:transglutaminase-like putative cysteine protease
MPIDNGREAPRTHPAHSRHGPDGSTPADPHLAETAHPEVSLPLYVAGLMVTMSGIMTVTASVSVNSNSAVGPVALLLTILGFAFSLACRHLRVQSRLIETACFAFLLFIGYELVMQRLDVSWFVSGADSADTQLAVGLMWLSVLRSWTLITDDQIMFSCVLTAAMIGLIATQDVNTITIVYFCAFLLALTFLLIHQNYLQNRRLASQRELSRPFGLLIPVQIGLTVLCGLIVISLGTVLIVPAQAVFARVSLTGAIRDLVGTTPSHDSGGSTEGKRFSDESTLSIGLGSVWPTTSDVLLHVAPSDNAPHYWRGRTYDLYTGTGWESDDSMLDNRIGVAQHQENGQNRYIIDTADILGEGIVTPNSIVRRPMTASFTVEGDTDEFYYADEPRSLTLDAGAGNVLRLFDDGRIDMGGRPIRSVYAMTSDPSPDPDMQVVAAKLRHDGTDYPVDVAADYLKSPLNPHVTTPADVRAYRALLAEAFRGLPANRHTPFDKAMAIKKWISGHCTYSLDVKPIPAQSDHVLYFLTKSRRGYCDMFASSMVILCRMAGIPARLATGFAPGDRDSTGFNLRALDKHAWAEVYFPSDRWLVFDATIGTRTDGSIPIVRAPRVSFWPRIWHSLVAGNPTPVVLLAAILLALAYIFKTELYGRRSRVSRRERRAESGGWVHQRYDGMMRVLARLGLPRHPWETPTEYERRALPFLRAQEQSLGISLHPQFVSDVTARFSAVRYGAASPDPDSKLDCDLRDFAAVAGHARRLRFWRRIFQSARPREMF